MTPVPFFSEGWNLVPVGEIRQTEEKNRCCTFCDLYMKFFLKRRKICVDFNVTIQFFFTSYKVALKKLRLIQRISCYKFVPFTSCVKTT